MHMAHRAAAWVAWAAWTCNTGFAGYRQRERVSARSLFFGRVSSSRRLVRPRSARFLTDSSAVFTESESGHPLTSNFIGSWHVDCPTSSIGMKWLRRIYRSHRSNQRQRQIGGTMAGNLKVRFSRRILATRNPSACDCRRIPRTAIRCDRGQALPVRK